MNAPTGRAPDASSKLAQTCPAADDQAMREHATDNAATIHRWCKNGTRVKQCQTCTRR
jgi:hypothetical protein